MNTLGNGIGFKAGMSWMWALVNLQRNFKSLNALLRVMGRDYFQRAWVVQEIVLAKELVFFVGLIEICPESILKGVHFMDSITMVSTTSISRGGPVDSFVSSFWSGASTSVLPTGIGYRSLPHLLKSQEDQLSGQTDRFEDFLFLCRDREATNAEDKVFSMLGLLDEELGKPLRRALIKRLICRHHSTSST